MSRLSRTILFLLLSLLTAGCFDKSKVCEVERDPFCFSTRGIVKRKH